jgi:hypothetical protein
MSYSGAADCLPIEWRPSPWFGHRHGRMPRIKYSLRQHKYSWPVRDLRLYGRGQSRPERLCIAAQGGDICAGAPRPARRVRMAFMISSPLSGVLATLVQSVIWMAAFAWPFLMPLACAHRTAPRARWCRSCLAHSLMNRKAADGLCRCRRLVMMGHEVPHTGYAVATAPRMTGGDV